MWRRTAVELRQVRVEVPASLAGLLDHGGQPEGLCLENLDLAIDAFPRIADERAPLVGIAREAEALPISFAGCVILQELAGSG